MKRLCDTDRAILRGCSVVCTVTLVMGVATSAFATAPSLSTMLLPSGTAISAANFPDDGFRGWVSQYVDVDGNGVLSREECAAVSEIDLYNEATGTAEVEAKNLVGLEYFPNLTRLDCTAVGLTSLTVSRNTALRELFCGRNRLVALDLAKNVKLQSLDCCGNKLRQLDLSCNSSLNQPANVFLSGQNPIAAYSWQDDVYVVDLVQLVDDTSRITLLDGAVMTEDGMAVFRSIPRTLTYDYAVYGTSGKSMRVTVLLYDGGPSLTPSEAVSAYLDGKASAQTSGNAWAASAETALVMQESASAARTSSDDARAVPAVSEDSSARLAEVDTDTAASSPAPTPQAVLTETEASKAKDIDERDTTVHTTRIPQTDDSFPSTQAALMSVLSIYSLVAAGLLFHLHQSHRLAGLVTRMEQLPETLRLLNDRLACKQAQEEDELRESLHDWLE